MDPTGHWVVSIDGGGIAAAFLGVKGQVSLAFDGHGNVGVFGTPAFAAGAGLGLGGGATLDWRHDTIYDLAGYSNTVGVTVVVTAEVGLDENGKPVSFSISGGKGGWALGLYASFGETFQLADATKYPQRLKDAIRRRPSSADEKSLSLSEYFKLKTGMTPDPNWTEDTMKEILRALDVPVPGESATPSSTSTGAKQTE